MPHLPTSTLLRIHNLLKALGSPEMSLDEQSREMVLCIARANECAEPIKSSDLRFDEKFGSPASSMKRLKRLIQNGWIETSVDPIDSRIQRLIITSKAKKRLSITLKKIKEVI